MEALTSLFDEHLGRTIGWALLHSLWQGLIAVLLLALALRVLDRKAAKLRYGLACVALMLMSLAPVATGIVIYRETASAVAAQGAPVQVRVQLPSPEEPPSPVRAEQSLLPSSLQSPPGLRWIALGWALGVCLSALRLLADTAGLHLLVRGATPAPARWQRTTDRLGRVLGMRTRVRLLESSRVAVPCAIGWLRPMILLPVSAVSGLAPAELEMILAHELSHLRRHDFAVNVAQRVVETLFFYHPGVRWASKVIRAERENCCDDDAVQASGSAVAYARALTELEALRVEPRVQRVGRSAVLSALGGSLGGRVRRLITPRERTNPRRVAGASLLTFASAVALAGSVSVASIAHAAHGQPLAVVQGATPDAGGATHPKKNGLLPRKRAADDTGPGKTWVPAADGSDLLQVQGPKRTTPARRAAAPAAPSSRAGQGAPPAAPVANPVSPPVIDRAAPPAPPAAPTPPTPSARAFPPAPPGVQGISPPPPPAAFPGANPDFDGEVPEPPEPPEAPGVLGADRDGVDATAPFSPAQREALREEVRQAKEEAREAMREAQVKLRAAQREVRERVREQLREMHEVQREQERQSREEARNRDDALSDESGDHDEARPDQEEQQDERRPQREQERAQHEQAQDQAQAARDQAQAAREQAQAAREQAKEQARAAREQAEAAREEAQDQAQTAREQAEAARERAQEQAQAAREQAQEQAQAAREQARAQARNPSDPARDAEDADDDDASQDWLGPQGPGAAGDEDRDHSDWMAELHVDPEYARSINRAFGHPVSRSELFGLHTLGVTADDVTAMNQSGLGTLSPDELAKAKAVGVQPDYVRSLKAAGAPVQSLRDCIRLKVMGVDASFVEGLRKAGMTRLSSEDLARMRALGVDGAFVDSMRKAGVTDLSPRNLERMRARGMTSDDVRAGAHLND